jgi:hypothetical protein
MNLFRAICFVAVGLIAASGAATAGGGPMADAGLDQSVSVNTTVQLDATGSAHPDGEIEGYEWRIETPDGRDIAPECATCARTAFTPDTPGRYEVTVTVTGSEGETASDTLYVNVEGVPSDSRDATETPDGDVGFDPVESSTPNEEPRNTIELDVDNVGSSVSEVNYETTIEINQCNAVSETGIGYTNSGNIDNCTEPEGEWDDPSKKQEAEVTVGLDNYEDESFSLSDLPAPEVPDPTPTKGSEGMGREGETYGIVSDAREAQREETGIIEGILYGPDSAEVTTYETSSNGAQALANADRVGSRNYDSGQGDGEEHGWNSVTQTGGPTGENMDEADTVVMTVETSEGSGILDNIGVSNFYSRDDYEGDRSTVGDFAGDIGLGISDTVKSAGSTVGIGEGENSDDSTPTATPTPTRDTTLSNDDSSSGSSPLTDSSSLSESSNDSSSDEVSGTDWQLPDNLGSDNDAGYATGPGL